MGTELTRVVVCDDHEIVREALRAQVDAQEDMEVVAEAGDAKAAVADTAGPDLAIVDVELPDSDGVAAKTGIQQATVCTHVRDAIHKLNVDSRTQAVAIATRYSYLEHEPEEAAPD